MTYQECPLGLRASARALQVVSNSLRTGQLAEGRHNGADVASTIVVSLSASRDVFIVELTP